MQLMPSKSARTARDCAEHTQAELNRILLPEREERSIHLSQIIAWPQGCCIRINAAALPGRVVIESVEKATPTLAAALGFSARFDRATCSLWFQYDRLEIVYATDVPAPAPWRVCIGKSELGWTWLNFSESPHTLVGGATQNGKTNLLKHIALQLLQMEGSKLLMVDPKRLSFGPISRIEGVELAKNFGESLEIADETVTRRFEKMTAEQQSEGIWEGERLFLFVDELAQITKEKQLGKILSSILARGAQAGVHCILATQHSNKTIIPQEILANIPEVIAFRTAKLQHSMALLDAPGAQRIRRVGQAIMKSRQGIIIQTPLITFTGKHSALSLVASAAQARGGTATPHTERRAPPEKIPTPQQAPNALSELLPIEREILLWCIRENSGVFSVRKCYAVFRKKTTWNSLAAFGRRGEEIGALTPTQKGRGGGRRVQVKEESL